MIAGLRCTLAYAWHPNPLHDCFHHPRLFSPLGALNAAIERFSGWKSAAGYGIKEYAKLWAVRSFGRGSLGALYSL